MGIKPCAAEMPKFTAKIKLDFWSAPVCNMNFDPTITQKIQNSLDIASYCEYLKDNSYSDNEVIDYCHYQESLQSV